MMGGTSRRRKHPASKKAPLPSAGVRMPSKNKGSAFPTLAFHSHDDLLAHFPQKPLEKLRFKKSLCASKATKSGRSPWDRITCGLSAKASRRRIADDVMLASGGVSTSLAPPSCSCKVVATPSATFQESMAESRHSRAPKMALGAFWTIFSTNSQQCSSPIPNLRSSS